MSSYFFELYFPEKVTRPQLETAIQQLPDVQPGSEGPDHYWVCGVHLFFHNEDLEVMFREIEACTGMVTGKFSLDIGVHNYSQQSTNEMLDVILALVGQQDFVAVYECESLKLWQKDGELTVDSVGLGQPTRDYIQSKRPCRFEPIGLLLEGE